MLIMPRASFFNEHLSSVRCGYVIPAFKVTQFLMSAWFWDFRVDLIMWFGRSAIEHVLIFYVRWLYCDLNLDPLGPHLLTKHSVLIGWMDGSIDCLWLGCDSPTLYNTFSFISLWHVSWRLKTFASKCTAKHRVGNIITFLPHSHTNTPCRHSSH